MNVVEVTIEAVTHGRYLVVPGSTAVVLVGFHGYAESPDTQMERLQAVAAGRDWRLLSIQGLHRFYERRTDRVVASWMTRQDRELAMADNATYVNRVLSAAVADATTASRFVYLGFSQGVAMAYRAAVSAERRAQVAVGGDIPPELPSGRLARLTSVLLCRGEADGWYTSERFDADRQRLGDAGVGFSAALLAGGHEWSADVTDAVRAFIEADRG